MDLKSPPNPIDSAGPVKSTLSNLFYGWGYNFYRKENQLRADDLLIRGKIGELLGECRGYLKQLETDFRRIHLPPPTREQPLADRSAVATAQALERCQRDVEAFETRIRNAAVPEMDRIHQRHRNERDTLERLATIDQALVGAVCELRDQVLKLKDGESAAREAPRLIEVSAIDAIWRRREDALSVLQTAGR